MRRGNTWPVLALAGIMGILILASGCLSPDVLLPEQRQGGEIPPTAVPTESTYPVGAGGEPVPGVAQASPDAGGPQHFVATPYGYVLTRPVSGTRLSIIEIKEETDETGQKYLTGKIKNEEQVTLNHITLQFNLYNANGHLIGNTYASVNSLAPQKTWKFTTQPFPPRDYHHYEMAEIFIA